MDALALQDVAIPVRSGPLVPVAVALAAGICLDAYLPLRVELWCAAAAIALLLTIFCWYFKQTIAAGGILLLAVAALGGARYHQQWRLFKSDEIGLFAGPLSEPTCVDVICTTGARHIPAGPRDPLHGAPPRDHSRIRVRVVGIRDAQAWLAASGETTLIVDGRLSGVHAGDRLRVQAKIVQLAHSGNPDEFDFADYARADRQLCALRCDRSECIVPLGQGSLWSWRRWIDLLRAEGDRLLWQQIPPQRAALASAILLGAREEMTADRTEPFLTTGTIHVLSVSGLHVAILAIVLGMILQLARFPRRLSAMLIVVATGVYTLLTDAEPPAVRAMILIWIACCGLAIGRRQSAINTLALAAIVVLALNPTDLFRVGPQLSFMCVAVIAWWSQFGTRRESPDPLQRLIASARSWPMRFVHNKRSELFSMLRLSTALWLAISPLVLFRMHLLSPVALVLNPLLSLPTFVAMASGLMAVAVGFVAPWLSFPLAWVCDASLATMDWLIQWGARAPLGHWWLPGPSAWWLLGFYLILLGVFWFGAERLSRARRWALVVGWLGIGFAVALLRPLPAEMRCTALSVGHGLAVVVELPDGRVLLYDAGRQSAPTAAARSIAAYLWSRGRTHIDAVVLSHADTDHYNALPELLERFSVGVVYVSGVMFDQPNESLGALKRAIESRHIPLREVATGARLSLDRDVRLEVMHPSRGGVIDTDNANSIVLVVEAFGHRALLTGDLEGKGLSELLADPPVHCEMLLAPHHGSVRLDPASLVRWCTPRWAVISAPLVRETPRALQLYHAAGVRPLDTGPDGATQMLATARECTLRCWLPGLGHWREMARVNVNGN